MKLIKLKIMYGQGTCPMAVQWSFIGQPKIRNLLIYGEPAGARTRDPRLKRAMLYQLSYRLTERRARILPPTLSL